MLKAVFFDAKDYEIEYFKKHLDGICEIKFFEESIHCFENLDKISSNIDVISIFTSSRISKEIISKFPKLKIIATRSTGFSHIDTSYCSDIDIPVLNVKRYGDCTIAEFAFGLMLSLARKIQLANEDLKKGIINTENYIGNDLYEKTIGIIGTGAIGSHSARIANGFGMEVLAFDPYPNQALVEQYGAEYVPLQTLLNNSDYISIHAPATKSNFHMINKESFRIMKDGVIIVNTARGEIIDTEALYNALLSKKVKAAGLDVVECEEILGNEEKYFGKIDCVNKDCLKKTLINHKLLELPNVIVTPHVAFDSQEAIERIIKITTDNIIKFTKGEITNKVN